MSKLCPSYQIRIEAIVPSIDCLFPSNYLIEEMEQGNEKCIVFCQFSISSSLTLYSYHGGLASSHSALRMVFYGGHSVD